LRASIVEVEIKTQKNKTRKTRAESKTDVIPNWVERPMRACPELAEGNLLSLTITATVPLRRKP
jgi:hypothetical protein